MSTDRAAAHREAVKRWRRANREKDNATRRDWHRRRQESRATRPRPEQCEICGNTCSTERILAWDHDHATGKFRGWLCYNCNVAIGAFRDSPQLCRKAAKYLEDFQ